MDISSVAKFVEIKYISVFKVLAYIIVVVDDDDVVVLSETLLTYSDGESQ